MSLTSLPEEVLEIILLHVNIEDILTVLSVVGSAGTEGFWRKVCLQNGYKKICEENELWKNVFCRNMSWIKGCFLKKVYNTNDSNLQVSSEHNFILKETKIISQKEDEVFFRDIENIPILQKKLKGAYVSWCNQSRSKLVIANQASTVIYSIEQEHYKKLFTFNNNICYAASTSYFLTDNYFVALKTFMKQVTVVDLNLIKEYSIPISSKKVASFIISLCGMIMGLVLLDGNSYTLRRYHLGSKEWLEEFQLFGGATMIGVPKIKMNSKVLLSWSSLLERNGVTPLKLWLMGAGSKNFSSSSTQMQPNFAVSPENILWLMLEEDHVIYSTSPSSLSIINLNRVEEIKKMPFPENNYCGQNIISGILVLSYTNYFKVVDYKNVTYLYDVLFDYGLGYTEFFINEYFYIVLDMSCKHGNIKKMFIYDFRGKLLDCI